VNNRVFVGFSRIFLLGILIFKGFTARRLDKSFGVKGLKTSQVVIFLLPLKVREDVLNRVSFAYRTTEQSHDIMCHDCEEMLEML
jgi:hypothetical protein